VSTSTAPNALPSVSLESLLDTAEPALRLKARSLVLGEDLASPQLAALREEVRRSSRATALLAERDAAGQIPYHPYTKWVGAHWVLAALADLGYPPGDASLWPLREQGDAWLLHPDHLRGMPVHHGRQRLHASMEANAILAQLRLGLADDRTAMLVQRLLAYQWPDGGWNCDRRSQADTSSFAETLLPLRALALWARTTGDGAARAAAARAAEVLLCRRLYQRRRDGSVMDPRFLLLHYPWYWHYDLLGGLVGIAEAGAIGDPRCADALDWLESRQLPGGGWPADGRHYQVTSRPPGRQDGRYTGRVSRVDWGPTGARRANAWVTIHALGVLCAAGRLPSAPRAG
jgi:hypothetical protein